MPIALVKSGTFVSEHAVTHCVNVQSDGIAECKILP